MKLKFTVGVNSTEAPIFMEGEDPGVFAIKEVEFDEKILSHAAIARFIVQTEDELLEEYVHINVTEIT